MMKHVRETLAGRIGILEIYSLSQREKSGMFLMKHLTFPLIICAIGKTHSQRMI